MEQCDLPTLVELADKIATCAREATTVTKEIQSAPNGSHNKMGGAITGTALTILSIPKFEPVGLGTTLVVLRCIADACDLISLQLHGFSRRDWTALEAEDGKIWPSLQSVMELWLQNTQKSVEILKKDVAQPDSLFGKVAQGFRAAATQSHYGIQKLQEGTLEDAQMVTALLNLYRESRDVLQDNRLGSDFLAHDLEWKAMKVRSRTSQTREAVRPPAGWGLTHDRLADVSEAMAQRARQGLDLEGL